MADKAVTPSKITDGQIGKINELVAAQLRKSDFPSDLVQEVLKTKGGTLATNLVADLRRRVEAMIDPIVHLVKVDRSLRRRAALNATGRRFYVSDEVVRKMPSKAEGDEAELIFIKNDRHRTNSEVEALLSEHGLILADPYELIAFNIANPAFGDHQCNVTLWKDAKGKWCSIYFGDSLGERSVWVVRRDDWDGGGHFWFAGRRKN